MIYCSIDIETTGLDPVLNQTLEIGAILYESGVGEIARFHCFVEHEQYIGSAFALHLNRKILYKLANKHEFPEHNFFRPSEVRSEFGAWLNDHMGDRKITPAGKNFGSFDRQFLLQLLPGLNRYLSHKDLDPGSMFAKRDQDEAPWLSKCLEMCKMDPTVTHNALDDAQQVIDLIEVFFNDQE